MLQYSVMRVLNNTIHNFGAIWIYLFQFSTFGLNYEIIVNIAHCHLLKRLKCDQFITYKNIMSKMHYSIFALSLSKVVTLIYAYLDANNREFK
jgi:hypothetical protein